MSQIDSQSTTDEKDEETEEYMDDPQNDDVDHEETQGSRSGSKMTRDECLRNWPHDRQPGWSQYSDSPQHSQTSKVSCSLDVPLTQADPESFDPVRDPILSKVQVPETPKSGINTSGQKQAKGGRRMAAPGINKKEAEEQIQQITEYLEQKNYTVFTHKTTVGNYERTMHLAFFMYDGPNHDPQTPEDEGQQLDAAQQENKEV